MKQNRIQTDDAMQELRLHGTEAFPFEYYCDVVDEYETGCIGWHWHQEVEFGYVETGTVRCLAGGQKTVISKNEGIFINRNILHKIESGGGGVLPNFLFMPVFIAPEGSDIFRKYVVPVIASSVSFAVIRDPGSIRLMKALKAVCESDGPEKELEIHRLSEALWERLYRNTEKKENGTICISGGDLSEYRTRIMMQFIHEHYADRVRLEEIAASASISKSEALRCFHMVLGTTPVNYLISCRLNAAADMLRTKRIRVSAAAEAAGFENVSYFCRMFRKKYALSPTEYRAAGLKPADR